MVSQQYNEETDTHAPPLEVFRRSISEVVARDQLMTCDESATLGQVVTLIRREKVSAIVVTSNGALSGVFTERDFIKKIAGTPIDLEMTFIRDFMTKNPVVIKADESVAAAIVLMRVGRFRHLIVVDNERMPTSIISVLDVIAFLCDELNLSVDL